MFWGSLPGQFGSDARDHLTFMTVAGFLLFIGWPELTDLTREYGFFGHARGGTSRDEPQTYARHRAVAHSYRILSLLICVACIYQLLSAHTGLRLPALEYRNYVLFGFLFVSASLPSSILAWIEPDPNPLGEAQTGQ